MNKEIFKKELNFNFVKNTKKIKKKKKAQYCLVYVASDKKNIDIRKYSNFL